MCTYADCKTGDQCYDSWKDWIAHEQWSHNKVWQCLLHPEETFTIWAELETHLKKAHAITDDISDTDKKAMIQESTSNVVERACPFCLLATKSLEALQMHVATHLQRIALFALPRSTDIHDGSSAGEEGHSGQANKEFDDSRQGDIDDHGDSTRVEERDLMQCNSCEHIWYQEASELGCFECSSNDITVVSSVNFTCTFRILVPAQCIYLQSVARIWW